MTGKRLLDAQRILELLGLEQGMTVADFGAGRTGHMVLPAAFMVGDGGKVYAVDISREALSMLEGHRKLHLLHHVLPVWGDIEHTAGVAIPSNVADLVLVVNKLWAHRNHAAIAKEAHRVLKDGGRAVVIDWEVDGDHPIAPPDHLRVGPGHADRVFLDLGCTKCKDFRPSPWHWGTVYRKDE